MRVILFHLFEDANEGFQPANNKSTKLFKNIYIYQLAILN